MDMKLRTIILAVLPLSDHDHFPHRIDSRAVKAEINPLYLSAFGFYLQYVETLVYGSVDLAGDPGSDLGQGVSMIIHAV